MFFNSWQFAIFFLIVYALYLAITDHRHQNCLILIGSYYFYAAWDWRFLLLLFSSTLLDYICALEIDSSRTHRRRKAFLAASIIGNLTLLGFFKYCNFFLDTLEPALSALGLPVERMHLRVILPVGISFYTFQEMSYTIDVYRGELKATRSLLEFAAFVAFFPHMVAGPIMRASNLLRQFYVPRSLTYANFTLGCWFILWGLWKKIFVADNMAFLVDPVFGNSKSVTFFTAYLGVLAFAFQIYADFAGYSDIARGLAKLLGFELIQNFRLPYFSVNPRDFWRRWHVSLSTWLRDYLYIPLGGSRGSPLHTYRNLMITMLLGGLWHGAAWNFVWWGAYHGTLLSADRFLVGGRSDSESTPEGHHRLFSVLLMFHFTLFGWLLFRCTRQTVINGHHLDESWTQITEMLTSFRNGLGFDTTSTHLLVSIAFFALPLLLIEWFQYRTGDDAFVLKLATPLRISIFAALLFSWLIWGVNSGSSFIYFQF